MDIIEEFSDDRNKSWCVHCTGVLVDLETNVDHVPSKSFLQDPRPENLPTVPVCRSCNNGFSKDEAYMVAYLSSALSGTTDPAKQVIPSARRILQKSEPLRTAINRSSSYTTIGGDERLVWKPDLERIKRVVVKNARGHAFFEMGEPMMHEPASVRIIPLEYMTAEDRAEFEAVGSHMDVFPEVGSRMMTRVCTGQDLTEDGWVLVQEGVYRYVAMQTSLMTVRTVLYEFLAAEVRWGDD